MGEILVERTVAEVVPAVKGNKEQLDTVSCSPTERCSRLMSGVSA